MMYLHAGHDVMIMNQTIIAILDRQILEQSEPTRQFFDRLRALGRVHGSLHEAKSLIVTDDAVVCSPISATTLSRRERPR